jgi:hypothetical protein
MRVAITRSAEIDLLEGFSFYEEQAMGIGDYFIDSLVADIDSLALFGGIHPNLKVLITVRWPSAFRSPFTTQWKTIWSPLSPCLIAVKTRRRSRIVC